MQPKQRQYAPPLLLASEILRLIALYQKQAFANVEKK
jgi:hypothetical protein